MPEMIAPLLDRTMPQGKWEFDEGVTAVFDNMLSRSIPAYEVMRETVTVLACKFAKPGSWILDLGCSRGGALKPLIEVLGVQNHYIGLEISDPMIAAARSDLKAWIDLGFVEIRKADLRKELPNRLTSVILSILTLQFTPIEYRLKILQNAYDLLPKGGVFILVEKILGSDSLLDDVFVEAYYHLKGENGYSADQVARKRASLEGVLVPLTAAWNVDGLKTVGFTHIDCFWRSLNFAGWLAIK